LGIDGNQRDFFEDLQRMFTDLSEARCLLMLEARTINELSHRLHRNRSAITKDVGVCGKTRGKKP